MDLLVSFRGCDSLFKLIRGFFMHSHLGVDHTEVVMNIIDLRIKLYCPLKVP